MRSSVLFTTAVCAAGALASPHHKHHHNKRDVVVVTTTADPAPAVTAYATVNEATQQQQQAAVTVQQQPAQQPAQQPPATTENPPPPSTTENPAPPATTQQGGEEVWSTAWTWGFTIGGGQPSTLSTTSAPEPTAAPANDYQNKVLFNHNVHRSNHSASSLSWDPKLEETARKLAQKCVYKHDTSIDGGGYGQNIGYGVQENQIGKMITNLMYNNEEGFFHNLYGTNSPSMALFESWGHFTQIVWKASTHVGCATVTCPKLGNVDSSVAEPFTVCNYSPAGNTIGEYADNVLAPLGHPPLEE